MATKFSVELKEGVKIDALVKALKDGAAKEDIEFKGDNKKGEASKSGVKVSYVVDGTTVNVSVSVGFPASMKYSEGDIVNKIKAWLKPYIK
jgi:hypothetical protein